MVNMKKIIIGEIKEETRYDTPIELLKWAIQLSKEDEFSIQTNNPQLVEALGVLCGTDNVNVYLQLDDEIVEIGFEIAYEYLGEIYPILDLIRIIKSDENTGDDDLLSLHMIKEYEDKYRNLF